MNLAGHERAWTQWRAALSSKRMHHGWILAGKRGLGKAAFAMAAARELVATQGVVQPRGAHPDIIVLTNLPANREEERKRDDGKPFQVKRNITVDQIREMQQRLTTRPTLGPNRAIIVDSADDLEKSASNALLKSLEEPPAGSFFLLVAHRPGRLLPTIRSRCRTLSFAPLSDDEIEAVLQREAPQADADTRAAAMAASGGSPGVALEFVELDLGRIYTLMREIADGGDADFSLRGRLAEAMGARPDRQRQLAAVELARSVAARQMQSVEFRQIPRLVETHAQLTRLWSQVPTYNYDAGLLVMEIGTLLTSLAASSEAAYG